MTIERKVEKIESAWKGQKVEAGAVIDSETGKVLKWGHHLGRRRLFFFFNRNVRDNIITHWHPGGTCSFSYRDISSALMTGAKEARVMCETCVFVMEMPQYTSYRHRSKRNKSLKRQWEEAGFPTHSTNIFTRLIRRIRYGDDAIEKWRVQWYEAVDSFWREFALRNPGFDYMKFPIRQAEVTTEENAAKPDSANELQTKLYRT